ncbi:hypothetical protein KY290_024179 [Solanum tuberosum]|uniref:Late blight resistance protein Rpi-blb2 n=1 Tax=Solanum tuberosum TaxID=4113 RepID=A0ABQ7URQ6_SOLTU|nr:hypothetical protein KY290_024179 [Solanum tuberosum]
MNYQILQSLQHFEDKWGLDMPESLEDGIKFLKREFTFLDFFLNLQSFIDLSYMLGIVHNVQALFHDAAIDFGRSSEIDQGVRVTNQLQVKIQMTKLEIRSEYLFPKVNKDGIVVTPKFVIDFIDTVVLNLGNLLKVYCSSSLLFVRGPNKEIRDVFKELKLLRNFVCFITDRFIELKSQHIDFFIHVLEVTSHAAMVAWLYLPSNDNENQETNGLLSDHLNMKIKPIDPSIRKIYIDVLQALRSEWRPIFPIDHVADCVAGFVEILQHNLKALSVSNPNIHQLAGLQEMLNLLIANLSIQELEFHLQDIDTVMIDSGILVYSLCEDVVLGRATVDLPVFIEQIKILIYHIIRKEFQSNLPRIHGLGYVDFVLSNLKEFQDRYPDSLAFMKIQLQKIQKELESVQPFLRSVTEQQYNTHDQIQNSVSLLIGKAYEVEYIVDACVSKRVPDWCLMRWLVDISVEVAEMQQKKLFEVDLVSPYTIATDTSFKSSELEKMPEIKEEIIGFEDEIETLIDRLTRGSGELDIISIVGMPGTGKTTLANRLYFDDFVVPLFDIRAQCHVSPAYSHRGLILSLLWALHVSIDETSLLSKETVELEDILIKNLKTRRYLILLDDVWNRRVWHDLKYYFPDSNNRSRILLTTRNCDVADYVGSVGEPHHLRLLTYEESWELLKIKVFGNENCSPLLEKVGQEIARKCGGLPLSIVLVAGILSKMEKTEECWSRVAKDLGSHIACDAKAIIEPSYQYLPYYLKPCFLYFGTFLEGEEINVSKLTWLWIGEGFVNDLEGKSLQDIAKGYLNILIKKNLVMNAKRSSDGKVKACRVHDLLLDFCKKKAEEEHFLSWIKWDQNDKSLSGIPSQKQLTQRRLTFYCEEENLVKWSSSCCPVDSVHFGEDKRTNVSSRQVPQIFYNFKFLKVLNLESTVINSFPTVLVYLRYFAAQTDQDSITSLIANLWNLETLILKPTKGKLKLPVTIMKMVRLRHLCIDNAYFTLNGEEGLLEKLEVLSTPCFSCAKDVELLVQKTPNLRELRCSFVGFRQECLPCLDFLEKLEIHLAADSTVSGPYIFPATVRNLTLSNFFLGSCHRSNISMLPNLRVLKLVSIFFDNDEWEVRDDEFFQLEVLKLVKCEFLEEWNVSKYAFCMLEHLVLRECPYLKEIPFCFRDKSVSIKVKSCSESVERSATDIKRYQEGNYWDSKIDVFSQKNRDILSDTSSQFARNLGMNEVMVGRNDVMDKLRHKLIEGSSNLDVISIVGLSGVGKTTLANNLYFDPSVVSRFDIRAQCCVRKEYSLKDLLLVLLGDITEDTSKLDVEAKDELADMLHKLLRFKRYLIFVDDIWDTSVWADLKLCFSDSNNGSRIILTTRFYDVASYATKHNKVFNKESCPLVLEDVGKSIAQKCRGLPLSIVLVAGVLARMPKERHCWEQVATKLSVDIQGQDQFEHTMDLSYWDLPNHLKSCVLYLAVFPKGREIQVSEITCLWIAKGFMETQPERLPEDIAEDYLENLVERNLVMVSERSFDGRIKACHIHDPLFEFYWKKAHLEIPIKRIKGDRFDPSPATRTSRRLFLQSWCDNLKRLCPYFSNLKSFQFREVRNSAFSLIDHVLYTYKRFSFLKVLDFEFTIIDSLPQGLTFLRYLAFRTVEDTLSLPTDLLNLETLIVEGVRGRVSLPITIWKMVKLRHLDIYDQAFFTLNNGKEFSKTSSTMDDLQFISTVCFSCVKNADKVLDKTPNLRIMKCEVSKFDGSFPAFSKLIKLEKLEISSGEQLTWINDLNIPRNLKELTLSNFRINLNEVATLSNLEVLKLLGVTISSNVWEVNDEQFLRLKFLKLENPSFSKWDASDSAFPCLERLELKRCRHLSNIPSCFEYSLSLKSVKIISCNDALASSAMATKEIIEYLNNIDLEIFIRK